MAIVLAEFPRLAFAPKGTSKYDKWLDGQVWQLTRDVDFSVTTNNIRNMLIATAKKRGMRARTHVNRSHPDVLIVQAIKKVEQG